MSGFHPSSLHLEQPLRTMEAAAFRLLLCSSCYLCVAADDSWGLQLTLQVAGLLNHRFSNQVTGESPMGPKTHQHPGPVPER